MQNMDYSELQFNVTEASPHWYKLWLKTWNYSHWLITSVISSLILAEIAAVILSAYPSLFASLWLSLGISSSLTIGIVSVAAILSLGLVSGWLLYAGHLAYQAASSLELDYEPLVKLWSINGHHYDIIFKKLLDDDNFLKLSRFIKYIPAAKGIHDYLQNPRNVDSVRKILQLLDKLWSADALDQQSKTLGMLFLSGHMQTAEADEHINNIFALCEILWQNKDANHDLFVEVIKNSSLLKPHLEDLKAISADMELFSKYIVDPSLILTHQFIESSPHDFAEHEFKQDEEESISNLVPQSEAAKQIKQIFAHHYDKNPQILEKIGQKLIEHPQLEIIEPLIQALSALEDGHHLLADEHALEILLDLSFARTSISEMANFAQLAARLYGLGNFSSVFMQTILFEKPLALSLELLKGYHNKIYKAQTAHAQVALELEKLLIDNQDIIDKCYHQSAEDLGKILVDTFKTQAKVPKRLSLFSMSWGASALKAQKKTTREASSAEEIKPIAARARLDFVSRRETMFPKPSQDQAVLGRPSSHSI
ncbi:MAG: hypothetical protein EBY16_01905 [Gammaproteobacteria bacterium]|nr:hypothetical protein [Gammaproteobacteria bacterium]